MSKASMSDLSTRSECGELTASNAASMTIRAAARISDAVQAISGSIAAAHETTRRANHRLPGFLRGSDAF